MTNGVFNYIDLSTFDPASKPWGKVDIDHTSYKQIGVKRPVYNVRGQEASFTTDNSGFQLHHWPSKEKSFTDESAIRGAYYDEIEQLLREKLPGIKKVVIFDHTIRRRSKDAVRGPVQQVHVDQTAEATRKRVFRHVPKEEAEELVKGRFQIINVWRPIENLASDFPLAVIDWRTTAPKDFVPVDLLYPKREPNGTKDDDDDRGHEKLADPSTKDSTEGYEVKGETIAIASNEGHRFYYVKDMTPEEALFLKCYDSRGDGEPNGTAGIAVGTPHTAFEDPETPKDAPGRQSIEVRCLVFYD